MGRGWGGAGVQPMEQPLLRPYCTDEKNKRTIFVWRKSTSKPLGLQCRTLKSSTVDIQTYTEISGTSCLLSQTACRPARPSSSAPAAGPTQT
jgi:hypothetical protein